MTDGQFLASPLALIAAAVLGYLLGSIPFGLVLTRAAGLGDIRAIGSGNIGTTNVLRTGRKDLAAATLLLDAIKGTIAVLVARYLWGMEAAIIAGLFAFIGHIFPVWLKFKGGKGVATYLGLLAAFAWPVAIVFALVWMAVAFTTRYSSASALTASLVSPIALLLLGYPREAILFALLSLALWYMHRANIGRLLDGTESKIGKKA
ncbi:glycerol-3-phosphate 1-O-acyltransferase PlsY [Labrys okinawensis]|uniref:glycerol-3-phosphate 1-O-acyltransferase PlsY n=1 Tax=Labrys okinawensis TaxID=346911 RepID=UPI0039BD5D2F